MQTIKIKRGGKEYDLTVEGLVESPFFEMHNGELLFSPSQFYDKNDYHNMFLNIENCSKGWEFPIFSCGASCAAEWFEHKASEKFIEDGCFSDEWEDISDAAEAWRELIDWGDTEGADDGRE